jgi:enoyl-CoA hydratase/carnithine racemase
VVVLEAEGKDFSAGVDLTDPGMLEIARQPMGRRRRQLRVGPRAVEAIQTLPQTTIAAMQGHCLGGGGCLALACDLRVAAADLSFGMPEVERGMNMSWHTVPLMVAHFGPTRTKELLITGHRLDAEEAVAWGLANRRTEDVGDAGRTGHAARDEARRWARQIGETVPPIAASMVKETVNAVANALTPLAHMDGDQFLLAQSTEDFREAVTAFLEKRMPRFHNG